VFFEVEKGHEDEEEECGGPEVSAIRWEERERHAAQADSEE